MSTASPLVQKWLPAGSLAREASRFVPELIQSWAAHWLSNPVARVLPLPANNGVNRPRNEAYHWFEINDALCFGRDQASLAGLAGAMLDYDCATESLRATERGITDALAERALDDLIQRFSEAAGLSDHDATRTSCTGPSANETGWRWWSIGIGSTTTVFIGFSESTLVEFARSTLPSSEGIMLESLAKGLAVQSIDVGVRLGRGSVELAQATQLAIGDVLVLDRNARDDLELTIGGQPTVKACSLASSDGRALLVMGSNNDDRKTG